MSQLVGKLILNNASFIQLVFSGQAHRLHHISLKYQQSYLYHTEHKEL